MKHKISGLIVYVFYCFFFFSVSQRRKKKNSITNALPFVFSSSFYRFNTHFFFFFCKSKCVCL